GLAALPTRAVRWSAVVDARHMTTSEVAEWERARRQLYAGDVCGCLTCLEAGVADQPRRFVPIDNSDGGVLQAWHPERKQLVPGGEGVPGGEVGRWGGAAEGRPARDAALHADAAPHRDETDPVHGTRRSPLRCSRARTR